MPVETDRPDAAIGEPEALIEEARQLQRRRARRRTALLVGLAVLVVLGIAAGQLARGGSGVAASQSPAAAAAVSAPTVRHMRLEIVKYNAAGLPPERRIDELWSASSTPAAYRWVVRLPGKPAFELGGALGQDKVLGAEQVYYLYDPASATIYKTGANVLPPGSTTPTTPAHFFRTMLTHGAHITGTTTYRGRAVYVLTIPAGNGANGVTGRFYVEKKTFVPLKSVTSDAAGRTVTTTLSWQDLPATRANVALASLAGRHPHARVVAATDRIRQQYLEATWTGLIAYAPHSLGN